MSRFARISRRAVTTSRSRTCVVERADRRERIDALDEQRLVLVDVADAGERPLVEQRLADAARRALGRPKAAERLGLVEVVGEDVGTEGGEDRMQRLDPRVSNSSTAAGSKQTATAFGTSRTRCARDGARRHRSPGR